MTGKLPALKQLLSEVFDGPFGSNLKSKDYSEGWRESRPSRRNIGWFELHCRQRNVSSLREKHEVLRKHTLRSEKTYSALPHSLRREVRRLPSATTELSEQAINKADCFCARTDPSVCLPEVSRFTVSLPFHVSCS